MIVLIVSRELPVGRNLLINKINQLKEVKEISRIVVSSDSDMMLAMAKERGVIVQVIFPSD